MFQADGFSGINTGTRMLMNSFILGIGFAFGKIFVGMLAAYAIVYFRMRYASLAFWIIFTTLLLPLEVRILPSYEVVQRLGMLNTYQGLIIPLIASATATFFFRQYFRSIPEELVEAARIDGAGPVRFFFDILIPLSRTMIAAMFIIMFVYGWNQYLWPTMVTTEEGMFTLVRGIKQITQMLEGNQIPEYGRANMLALIAILPPVMIVIFFQSWFVKGLTESDK
jgi:sn-glycerol 3-phosphate transport system permease protein